MPSIVPASIASRSLYNYWISLIIEFDPYIQLPADLVEGDYRARIFLLRDKQVIDVFEDSILVRKVGLERWIYAMAQEQSALYGLGSILLALFAGWAASTIFRMVLR